MKYAVVLAAIAGLAVAAPGTPLTRRVGPRSRPNVRKVSSNPNAHNTTQVEYSSNWSGVVKHGTGINSVTGTITVPKASGGSQAGASAWVGIDGDTCQTALLQTGVTFYGDGTYDAWYEWIPDYEIEYGTFAISTGDQITMTVTAASKTKGTTTLKNLRTGKSVSHTFTNPPSSLCQTDAEWIVEDFESGNSLVPFADYGSVTFTGASANSNSGTLTPAGGDVIDLEDDNGDILSTCSISGNNVNCQYTG